MDLTDEELAAITVVLKIAVEFSDVEWGDAHPDLLQSALEKIEAYQTRVRTEGSLAVYIDQFDSAIAKARRILAEVTGPAPASTEPAEKESQ
jgi:hypothetical protein